MFASLGAAAGLLPPPAKSCLSKYRNGPFARTVHGRLVERDYDKGGAPLHISSGTGGNVPYEPLLNTNGVSVGRLSMRCAVARMRQFMETGELAVADLTAGS